LSVNITKNQVSALNGDFFEETSKSFGKKKLFHSILVDFNWSKNMFLEVAPINFYLN
jgi:hypothetical protein